MIVLVVIAFALSILNLIILGGVSKNVNLMQQNLDLQKQLTQDLLSRPVVESVSDTAGKWRFILRGKHGAQESILVHAANENDAIIALVRMGIDTTKVVSHGPA